MANTADIAGVHVLHQFPQKPLASKADALKELTQQTSNIKSALDVATHFGMRVPWYAVEKDFELFDKGLAIARAEGKDFTVRIMAGRSSAPAALKSNTFTSGGTKAPAPFLANGALNTVFLTEYRKLIKRLMAWCKANGVKLLHNSHYAKDWAEFYYGPEIQKLAGTKSPQYFVAATEAILDIAFSEGDIDTSVWQEAPGSGHGPLMRNTNQTTPGIAEQVTQWAVKRAGDRYVVQANGWDEDGIWGASGTNAAQVERNFDHVLSYGAKLGVQMIQPYNTYNWGKVFGVARAKGATYCEVYLPSFKGGTSAQLRTEVEAFTSAA